MSTTTIKTLQNNVRKREDLTLGAAVSEVSVVPLLTEITDEPLQHQNN